MPLFSSQSALGKWLRWPLRFIAPYSKMTILSGPLRGKKWVAGSANHGCWLGTYEWKKIRIYSQKISKLQKDSVIFDFGANVGIYSLVAAVKAPSGIIHAFEPVPANIRYLKEHLNLNHIENVVVHPVVVGKKSGVSHFSLGHSSATGKADPKGPLTIPQIQIDEEIKTGRLPPPHLIKMDIEGAELDALEGARETLKKFRPQLFIATHSAEIHQQCLKLLSEIGYKIKSLDSLPLELTDEIYAYIAE